MRAVKPKTKRSNSITKNATSIGHGGMEEKELLQVLREVKNGNFSVRMPID